MPVLPTPSGGTTRTVAQWAAYFDSKLPGKNAGKGYTDYAAAHPGLTAGQSAVAFDLQISLKGVGKAVSDAVSGLSKFTTAGAVAVGKATKPFSVNSFLGALTSRGLWIRIAEGSLGILLILVSVAKLAEGTQIGKLAKKVPLV